jgi:putative ABC transport system permease protein
MTSLPDLARVATDRLRTSLETLVRYPGRSALTVLGLAIGVAAFIAMVSFGEGARRSVLSQFEAMGTQILIVSTSSAKRPTPDMVLSPLTDQDVAALRRETTTLAEIMPVATKSADVSREGLHLWTGLFGTSGAFTRIHEWPLTAGGMFTEDDVTQRAKVCVLGETPLRELFGGRDPLGQSVTVAGALPCRVVGVLAGKGYSTAGSDLDNVVLVPITTYAVYVEAAPPYGSLELRPLSPALMDVAKAEVVAVLRRTHRIERPESDDFKVTSPLEVVRAVARTSRVLSDLLKGIAAISLLVGGIGIMNIQLVSVAERTQEIGIRAAIGASPRQILNQFLSEALALTVVGALVGVGLGLVVATVTAGLMQWPRAISPLATLTSALFALAVGLLFGYLPARRAARLDPIEALRHE